MSAKRIRSLKNWECQHAIMDLVGSIARHKRMGLSAESIRLQLQQIIARLKETN